jgi:NAD(P)-dependent dehydrogenase (short-subunit alcohol dehydrogenase family)
MSRAALPHLVAAHGAIVNIGAAAAIRATAGMSAYAASKSAVARLTESLADEVKDVGVRVNAVLPSIIDGSGRPSARLAQIWHRSDVWSAGSARRQR